MLKITDALILATLSMHPVHDIKPKQDNALFCLATNMYHEARSYPVKAQLAVGHVTMTRHKESDNKNLCQTVKDAGSFSWVRDKQRSSKKLDQEEWNDIVIRASKIMKNQVKDPTNGATHFCMRHVRGQTNWCRHAKVKLVVKDMFFVVPIERHRKGNQHVPSRLNRKPNPHQPPIS